MRAFVALVVVACGAKQAERLDTPDRLVAPAEIDAGVDAMDTFDPPKAPAFRLVGLIEGPTWPLTDAPSLEPHYRVTSPWYEACARRGRLPDDALAYVEAWCKYRGDSRFAITSVLSKLRATSVVGLGTAIRRDLANLWADQFDANAAVSAMTAVAGYDGDLYELLIATYIDAGKVDQAARVAERFSREAVAKDPARCGREVTELTFSFEPARMSSLVALAPAYGDTPGGCGARAKVIACVAMRAQVLAGHSNNAKPCLPTGMDEQDLSGARALAARLLWVDGSLEPEIYMKVAELATGALFVYDAEELALSALEAALVVSCSPTTVGDVQVAASRIQVDDHAHARFDARRTKLVEMTQDRCEMFRRGNRRR